MCFLLPPIGPFLSISKNGTLIFLVVPMPQSKLSKAYMSFWFKCFDFQSYWRERKGNETGQIDTSTIPHRPGGMLRRKFSGQAMSEEIMIEFLVFDFTKFDMQSELASRISTNHFLQEAELWVILYSLYLTNLATLITYSLNQ